VLAAAAGGVGGVGATQVMPMGGGYPGDPDEELIEVSGGRARLIRNTLILVGSLLVAGLIIYAIFALTRPKTEAATNTVAVPNVVQLQQAAAVSLLQQYALTAAPKAEASTDVPAGLVIRSDPAADVVVAKQSTVTIYVSSGPSQATVPKVLGLTQDDATALIEHAGLSVKTVVQDNSDPTIPVGRATKTDPPAATVVSPDTPVTLYISSGKVQLPDVTNKNINDATTILAALGLGVDRVPVQTDAKPPDTVMSQTPQPGLVAQGSAVQLSVATPVVYHSVPALVGKSESEATAGVQALNFVANVTRQNSASVPAGKVISQSPAPNTQLAEGQTVNFVVSLGPTVPST
jgi:serine/threonine-protein kinase